MKLSWSHKVFLHINALQRRHRAVDRFMIFSAFWLIYIIIAAICIWSLLVLAQADWHSWWYFLGTVGTTFLLALATSYTIAYFFPHRRPVSEFPEINELIHLKTFERWKSFPSDHTLAAFLFVFIAMIAGLPLSLTFFLLGLAVLVAIARVYVGVHYPRDIIGGFILAGVYSFLAFPLAAFLFRVLTRLGQFVTSLFI